MEAGAISRALVMARRLRVDSWAAEAVAALDNASIPSVLLKGPAIARWLYPDEPERRGYNDVDLLVKPEQLSRAHSVLLAMGYLRLPHPELDRHILHAVPYERPSDRAAIDLHRTLHGLQDVSDALVWEVVTAQMATMEVGRVACRVPSIPVRIAHLVLHLSHDDSPDTQPWQDLLRALDRGSAEEWDSAVALARKLGAENEFALRLRQIPEGAERADELGIGVGSSAYYRLREAFETGRAPESAHSLYALSSLPDWSARRLYIRRKLWPSAEAIRGRHPFTSGGDLVLRFRHLAVQLKKLPAAMMGWLRYYRR